MNYIKFLERFGVIISLYIFWSIIFYKFADRTEQVWADLGALEAFVYLIGVTIGNYLGFIICLILVHMRLGRFILFCYVSVYVTL